MRSYDFETMIEETVEDVVKHRFLASCLDTWGKDRIGCHIYVLLTAGKENGQSCGVEDEHSCLVVLYVSDSRKALGFILGSGPS